MNEFPVANLKPCFATLFLGSLSKPCIEVHFEPFAVQDPFEGEIFSDDFDEPLRADFIELPTVNAGELLGQVFDFPLNPAEGYIDASVYFRNRHNPVDISRLEFGRGDAGEHTMTVTSRWLMTLEGSASNDFDYTFTVPIQIWNSR